jgi:hypothetical protein
MVYHARFKEEASRKESIHRSHINIVTSLTGVPRSRPRRSAPVSGAAA